VLPRSPLRKAISSELDTPNSIPRLDRRKFAILIFGSLVLASAYLLIEYVRQPSMDQVFVATYKRILAVLYFPILGSFKNSFLTVSFWCAIILTLCLQRLVPAKPAQKIFSLSFAQDVVWFFYETVLHAVVLVTYVSLIIHFYQKYFSSLTITSLSQTPGWVRFLIGLLLLDLLYWLQHYSNHKVPLLWQFHKLHHSQKELNFFTDFRYHVFEYIVRHTFLVIPFLILRVNPPVIVSFAVILGWYTRFYNGNIRTNLGPLKYILVTPQSHRVHHSMEVDQSDTNFGAVFSIWDFAFGTQCRNYDTYPDTGIDDESFPHEQTIGLKSLLLTPIYQMLYPLYAISSGSTSAADDKGKLVAHRYAVIRSEASETKLVERFDGVSE